MRAEDLCPDYMLFGLHWYHLYYAILRACIQLCYSFPFGTDRVGSTFVKPHPA